MAREELNGTEKFTKPAIVVLPVEVESSEFLDLSTKKLVEC